MTTAIQRELINQVRTLMSLLGISQSELARRVGFSEKHLSQMLTGRVAGSLPAWQKLLDNLTERPT